MALNRGLFFYNMIKKVKEFQDFFFADAKNVTFKYMDSKGNIITKTIPNLAKVTAELRDIGIEDKQLAERLNNYYTKSDIDTILASLSSGSKVNKSLENELVELLKDYYTKSGVNGLITALKKELNTSINTVKSELRTELNGNIKTEKTALKNELKTNIGAMKTLAVTTANKYTDNKITMVLENTYRKGETVDESKNTLKFEGKKLLATINDDGSFNDDGIFKIKEEDGKKELVGILDTTLITMPVEIYIPILDIFDDGKCVALFEFENNANDTGGVYNGTWYGTQNYKKGKLGLAASFDGSSLIRLPRDIYDARIINYPIAISAWVYLKAGETEAVIYNTGGSSNGLGFGIRGNKIYGAVQSNNTIDRLYGDTKLENEVWYFLTMVFDGSTKNMKLYINGTLDISKTMRVYPGSRAHFPSIGGVNYYSSTFYDNSKKYYTKCMIDHIRFFKHKLLTDNEVKILYNEGL